MKLVEIIASQMTLERAMHALKAIFGDFTLLDHWTQGEFHHDLVFSVPERKSLAGNVLVVSTNCNGGIKDVLVFHEAPDRFALWNFRCPDNPEFDGECSPLESARTEHWFHPCEILVDDARSELRPEHRERQRGGGWKKRE